jgi:UTP--glucose-1-phosphate uridylyltransferase
MKSMVELYERTGANIIAVEECDPAEAHKYGIVGMGADVHTGFEITGMVEKPKKGTAPSNLFINGRYILQPEIFDILENQERGAGNEIQLTDGMLKLASEQKFYGFHYRGRTFDCGSPEGFVEANVAFALSRPDMRNKIADMIEGLVADFGPERRRSAS